MKQTKEEKAQIRLAIYKFLGNIFSECAPCTAFRVPDGRIFVYHNNELEKEFHPDGRRMWDDQMQEMSLEESKSAVKLDCLECPAFRYCTTIDTVVDWYVDHYGKPRTPEDVGQMRQKAVRDGKSRKDKTKDPITKTTIEQSTVLNGTGLSLRSDLCEIDSPFWQTSIQVSGTLSSKTENRQGQDKDTPQRDDGSYIIGCPFCGQHLEVPIELDNTTVSCPSCNKEVYLTKEDAIEERCSKKNGSFRFECPFCQANLEVPDELDNTTANCPACNKEIHLTKKAATS